MAKFALVGDYNQTVTAHRAIPKALELAGQALNRTVQFEWINTADIKSDIADQFGSYDGIWVVPASPYQNMEGAIDVIQFARENNIPFMGTCGGYQHAVLEFARNKLGFEQAANAEVTPETEFPLIAPLVCSLVDQDGEIKLVEGTKAAELYGEHLITEQYRCSYGFNVAYLHLFETSDLQVTGFDQDEDPRIIELEGHPFFMGTAYQPERSSLLGETHPLIIEFVRAAGQAAEM